MMKNNFIIATVLLLILLSACTQTITPKPRGYFRISFPEKHYERISEQLPYSFEMPQYCKLEQEISHGAEQYWTNVVFNNMGAKIHLSFKYIQNNLDTLIDDSHTLAYKHTIKADAIEKNFYTDDSARVFAMVYNIKGNVASPIQFFATDSVKYFLRGSLYFNATPNKDSIAPVLDFVAKDITQLIETLRWEH
ncbi:MAG: gliding motility lipoprotein GldD [Bacteroidales bacterium]|nr:gliding motility lipoprotein GldD [Bacteroidales bacterium]